MRTLSSMFSLTETDTFVWSPFRWFAKSFGCFLNLTGSFPHQSFPLSVKRSLKFSSFFHRIGISLFLSLVHPLDHRARLFARLSSRSHPRLGAAKKGKKRKNTPYPLKKKRNESMRSALSFYTATSSALRTLIERHVLSASTESRNLTGSQPPVCVSRSTIENRKAGACDPGSLSVVRTDHILAGFRKRCTRPWQRGRMSNPLEW
jgi:hypothetical protein